MVLIRLLTYMKTNRFSKMVINKKRLKRFSQIVTNKNKYISIEA